LTRSSSLDLLARLALGLATLLLGACAAPPEPNPAPTRRETHDALFETFFPTDGGELSQAERESARAIREASAEGFTKDPTLGADLEALATSASAYGALPEGASFAGLDLSQREAAVARLFAAPDPRARAMARRLRSVYLGLVYRPPLGPVLVGDPRLQPGPPSEVEVPRLELPQSPLRYDSKTQTLRHDEGPIEFLIVGSGPAGSVLANRLTLAGRRVVLVERGSFVIPGALDTRSQGALMESRNRRTSLDGAIVIRNGNVVGGGSTVNIDLAFDPTSPLLLERIQGWVREGRLPPRRYSPQALRQAYAWVCERMGTRPLGEAEINANNRVLWEGTKARGVQPKLYALNRYLPAKSPTPVDNKISAVRGLLLDALSAGLSLLPDAEVTRVLLEGGRATGVEVKTRPSWKHPAVLSDPHGLKLEPGLRVRIEAQQVILAAGSLGSPTILLNSGISGPAIGRGVVIHPSVPLVGEFERRIDATRGLTASVFVDAHARRGGYFFEAMPGLPSYVAMMTPGTGPEVLAQLRRYRNLAGFGVMLVDTPHPENRVRLSAEGWPVVDYRLRGSDPARFRAGVAEAVRTMFAAGAKRVIVPSNEEGIPRVFERAEQARLVEERLKFVSGRTILTSAHMQGSLKLGASPSQGALAPDHRVWRAPGEAYENLYVVDGSVFPTSVGANPMQAIYTFARIAADRLLEPR
jgi:choline dehydrogenase-like flavoprotein